MTKMPHLFNSETQSYLKKNRFKAGKIKEQNGKKLYPVINHIIPEQEGIQRTSSVVRLETNYEFTNETDTFIVNTRSNGQNTAAFTSFEKGDEKKRPAPLKSNEFNLPVVTMLPNIHLEA